MQTLIPLAEAIAARLKQRGRDRRRLQVLDGRSDFGRPARRARCIGLLPRRRRRLHAPGPARASKHRATRKMAGIRWRASLTPRWPRAPCASVTAPPGASSETGATGPQRQPLRRPRRPLLHRHRRPDAANVDAANRQRRPSGQHARLRRQGPGDLPGGQTRRENYRPRLHLERSGGRPRVPHAQPHDHRERPRRLRQYDGHAGDRSSSTGRSSTRLASRAAGSSPPRSPTA